MKDELRSTPLSVVVTHLKVGCQPSYKVQRRRSLKEGRLLETNSVYPFMCGLIVGLEDLVHFRSNNNPMIISQDKLASNSKLAS